MTHKSHRLITLGMVALISLPIFVSCVEKELEPATVEIKDQIRHYYPVIQGEMLGIIYEFENTSENPLFIQEVQTTCGCLVPMDDLPITVLPNKTGYLNLRFNSIKNSGYVHHYVWCYGNFADSTYRELQFDTNVVPNADYTRDYEQLWHEKTNNTGSMRDFVDGESSEKGYYTDDGIDRREQNREDTQEAADGFAF